VLFFVLTTMTMFKKSPHTSRLALATLVAAMGFASSVWAAPDAAVQAQAQQQKQPLLDTLKDPGD